MIKVIGKLLVVIAVFEFLSAELRRFFNEFFIEDDRVQNVTIFNSHSTAN